MNSKPKGLGRGLDAIFEIENITVPASRTSHHPMFDEIELRKIHPNPAQPRTQFDEEALTELAESIAKLGVIQPITVRKNDDGTFTIISGERRFRASQKAGLTEIPAFVREVDDQTLIEMALVENIQREDLNAMEIALSMQRLVDECSLTQDTLAGRVGKKRSTVANYLRLLKLPAKIQLAIREELISMGHARALIPLENEKQQLELLKKIMRHSLSVRQVEQIVKSMTENTLPTKPQTDPTPYPETYARLVEHLENFFNRNISIRKNAKGEGKITIAFNSDEEVEGFLKMFENYDALTE